MNVRQVVQVKILNARRPYTYYYEYDPTVDRPLQLGTRVSLPPNQVQEEGSSGIVVKFGSDYNGPDMKQIVGIIEPKPADDEEDRWPGWGSDPYYA